jgi:hypothetical protein
MGNKKERKSFLAFTNGIKTNLLSIEAFYKKPLQIGESDL